jgi:Tol biopolymer transport system component
VRESQLTWLDRSGKPSSVVGRPGSYDGISLSFDGTRAALIQVGPSDTGLGNVDIWSLDLARGTSQRLTSGDSSDRSPTWSPKGDEIVFMSFRSGSSDLYVTPSTGAGAQAAVFTSKATKAPTSWSSDGRFVLFHSSDPQTPADIWLLPLTGERKPIAIVQTPFAESDARFSPDMKWIAYTSNASGRAEIYLRPFNAASPGSPSAAIIVSTDGGGLVRWRRDSRELFFQTPDGKVAAVGLEIAGGQVKPGVPVALFTLPRLAYWDVTGDGQRFLVTMPPAESGLAPINVLLNGSLR